MPSKALTVKDAFNDLAKSTLDSLIETVVQLSKPAVSDEMVNVHLDARSVHSLEDSILIDQVVRTVLRTVDEKRFLSITLNLLCRIDWTQWISLVPLVMHTVASFTAPNTPGS